MATLFIDPWKSRCGACNGNADPYEESHVNANMQGEGCGAVYTEVDTSYVGLPHLVDRIREMRSDLPYVGWDPSCQ